MKTMLVGEWMSKDVTTLQPTQRLVLAEEVLVREKITGAPVVENGRVVGVLSRSDLVRQLELERSKTEAACEAFVPFDSEEPFSTPLAVSTAVATRWIDLEVKDAMRTNVVHISPIETIAEAAQLMVEHSIHRLPVVDGDELVGVLSTLDVLRAVATL